MTEKRTTKNGRTTTREICGRKKRYNSYYSANRAKERHDYYRDDDIGIYWCPFCRGIHLGH